MQAKPTMASIDFEDAFEPSPEALTELKEMLTRTDYTPTTVARLCVRSAPSLPPPPPPQPSYSSHVAILCMRAPK